MTGAGRRLALRLGAAAALAVSGPALACVPPLPTDPPPPTLEQRVTAAFNYSTDIVYGVVTKHSDAPRPIRFKVLHVYKGGLKPGARIDLEQGWGLDPPPCVHMLGPHPVPKGAWGVILFHNNRPTLNFLSEEELELMFERGWIRRASRREGGREMGRASGAGTR